MVKKMEGTAGKIRLATAPMPAISAPMLRTTAGKVNNIIRYKTGFG